MSRIGINIDGIDKTVKKLQSYGEEGENTIAKLTQFKARDVEVDAKMLAPGNIGKLKQGITHQKLSKLSWIITATEFYSPYVEFGTASKVRVPPEMQGIASKVRSRNTSGTFKRGLASIKQWCRDKGIDEKLAYPIFMKILRVGIEPRPFMYPAWKKAVASYSRDLKKALDRLAKKYNK